MKLNGYQIVSEADLGNIGLNIDAAIAEPVKKPRDKKPKPEPRKPFPKPPPPPDSIIPEAPVIKPADAVKPPSAHTPIPSITTVKKTKYLSPTGKVVGAGLAITAAGLGTIAYLRHKRIQKQKELDQGTPS